MQVSLRRPHLPARPAIGGTAADVAAPIASALLACGIVSSVLYVVMDVTLSLRYAGYAYADQAISELNATGAPTRSSFLAFSAAYNLLLIAFGAGVWATGRKRAATITGALLIGSAAVGMATPLFFPMDQRGAAETLRGSMHGPMTLVGSLFILLAMGFGATLHGGRFRVYTYATVAALIVFGVATALYAPRVAANESTPAMGIIERVNIYAYLVWVGVLAAALLRVQGMAGRQPESDRSA